MSSRQVPQALVEAILAGNCVAFLGAGFSAGPAPTWRALLGSLATRLERHVAGGSAEARQILDMGKPSALELYACGQLLRDAYARLDDERVPGSAFEQAVRDALDEHAQADDNKPKTAALRKRMTLLASIPFDAVITTNYDHYNHRGRTDDGVPTPKGFRTVLREHRPWWRRSDWKRAGQLDVPLLKLHGSANGDPNSNPIVLAQQDYRQRIYADGTYRSFVKTVLATKTVLFLGVSFTDAYLNELRSEVLAMLDHRDNPMHFAVLADPTEATIRHFRRHEGVEVLDYATRAEGDKHAGFDEWLERLSAATSLRGRLGGLLSGVRILWIDDEANNELGLEVLESVAEIVKRPRSYVPSSADSGADLIITCMGYESETEATALRVLEALRNQDQRPPLIVFASGKHREANRRAVLRRGALDYCDTWQELFASIERLFASGEGRASS